MRMQLLKIVVVLLVAGSGDSRPQNNGADSWTRAGAIAADNVGRRSVARSSDKSHDIVRDDSSAQLNGTHRDLKDLQYMDQSLRTVATQLLNISSPENVIKVNTKELIKISDVATTPKISEKSDAPLMKDSSSNVEIGSVQSAVGSLSFGRPMNSKFGHFETSHPGQAMAITEEELEREMSSTTRLMTAHKNHPTTTGGISTWILLNPPSTTVKSAEIAQRTKQPFQTEVRLTVRPSSSIERVETIPQPENTGKVTPQLTSVITTEKITAATKKPTATTLKKIISTTARPPERNTQTTEKVESSPSTTVKVVIRTSTANASTTSDETASATTSTMFVTTKKNQPPRTTPKPKVTTLRTTKPVSATTKRPGQQNKPKPNTTRRTTVKPEATAKNETASTGKIEKVTFKPVQMIMTPKNRPENTERPMFVTKIKASVLMDTQKAPTVSTPTATASLSTGAASNLSGTDLVEVPVRSKPIVGTKVNNVLKVQLKKPVDETTHIEIEPIKVNAPILKIEKANKNKMDEIVEKDLNNNSRIDLKFDFNPELTKINVETEVAATTSSPRTAATSATTAASTTTKRPRQNSKRKKNKGRRRKPSTLAPSSTTVATVMSTLRETVGDSVTDATAVTDNAVQESKIAPETKIAANNTKIKKKQPPKAISTQIYNFLSREVMPSFGVMSLVGLGLGLASYFLYPFGGTIARRNYEVEPNYKYNLDEYGGNYGQNEEEVLSKVLQGMTNHEAKYPGAKDYSSSSNNYYRYQHYDGAYDAQTTKRIDPRYPSVSASPLYRLAENTQPVAKYRNTEYRYPHETQTTPIAYYDRTKHAELQAEANAGSANRQFVVGNVPKEYPYEVKAASSLSLASKKGNGYESTEDGPQFERDIAQSYNLPASAIASAHSYAHLDTSTVRSSDDGYEEIEITPTAVAVEHGPRSLKVRRAAPIDGGGSRSRSKRESVIQVIPSKHELEEEEKEKEQEEDLSNEILDIIELALPGGGDADGRKKTKNSSEDNEVEDLEAQKRREREEANKRAKESTLKTVNADDAQKSPPRENAESIVTTTTTTTTITVGGGDNDKTNGDVTDKASTESSHSTTPSARDTEPTTVEWYENSTTSKPTDGFSIFSFVRKVAEIKFRLGLTILKHASEGFARYLGHVQKRINGEE